MTICRPTEDLTPLLTPGEVAAMFRVKPATVWQWQRKGLLTAVFTPGGHRRYRPKEVEALLEQDPDNQPGSWS